MLAIIIITMIIITVSITITTTTTIFSGLSCLCTNILDSTPHKLSLS